MGSRKLWHRRVLVYVNILLWISRDYSLARSSVQMSLTIEQDLDEKIKGLDERLLEWIYTAQPTFKQGDRCASESLKRLELK